MTDKELPIVVKQIKTADSSAEPLVFSELIVFAESVEVYQLFADYLNSCSIDIVEEISSKTAYSAEIGTLFDDNGLFVLAVE